jgi:hypothetical protein
MQTMVTMERQASALQGLKVYKAQPVRMQLP